MTAAIQDAATRDAASARSDTGNQGPSGLPRLLPADGQPMDLAAHLRVHGPTPYRGGARMLIHTIESAGLTGRGGAAFPTHRKLTAVADQKGTAVVVGNGAEGEPASSKDQTLLWSSPHLVLDGLQLAAEAVGARKVHLYVHREPRLVRRLELALAERATAGLDRIKVGLVTAPARFLAGEESALANRVEGGAALPRFTPPRIFERGVNGAPTLVQNVETLAQLALISRYGPAWFRAVGTEAEPGSMLTTVRLANGGGGVAETPLGTPLARLLRLAEYPAQAVLVGGYHGAWLTPEQASRLTLSNADLRPIGAAVGAGVLAALPADRCGIVESARVVRYLALESAGQCGPCLNGLPLIADTLVQLANHRSAPSARGDLQRWSKLVERRGACHHPDGTVRFLRSALTAFAGEVALHEAGRCSAGSYEPFLPIPAGSPDHKDDWS
ncbi:MAG TPA: NADH-ubiquinone oxidoreductase-F iron-sulfur binding region domain-containing protein [Dermatophilaceae bacterium]|nr:NADH-ubiquinone oxidoreductase-F iron-sulfur binding region domain-containing protein [Dermatophilaceae bacterium]